MTRADSYMTLEYDIAAPRQKVWEYFTVPGQWQSWWPADAIIENSSKGRRGVGTEESLHARQGRDYRGDARLAPIRLLHGEHSSSDPGRAENRDDPCGAGQPERRYAPGISVATPRREHKDFVDQAEAKFTENIIRDRKAATIT